MEETKNNQKQPPDCDAAIKTAQFRFSLIAPVIQGLVPDESDTAYFMRITKEPLTLPDGGSVKHSWKTSQKWHSPYKKGGSGPSCQRPAPTKVSPVSCRMRQWKRFAA